MLGGKPKTLVGTSLTIEARAWQYFICQKMMPVNHYSNVIAERAFLVYVILMGMSIDVGQVIFYSIIHTIKNKLGLYFLLLIIQLCIRARVRFGNDEEALYPKRPINDGLISIIKASRVRSPEKRVEAAAPLLPPPRVLTVAEHLEHLEIRFDEHQQFLQDRFDRQDQFLSRQVDYQAAVYSSFGQMYQSFASTADCDMGSFPTLPPYSGSFFDPAPAKEEEEHDEMTG